MSDWRQRAGCKDLSLDIFFPDGHGNEAGYGEEAKSICNQCPVEQECLDAALQEEAPKWRYGIRGGMTGQERQKEYEKRKEEK